MNKKFIYLPIIILLLFAVSCKSSINSADLYGKWKYVKVEHPDDPTDSVRSRELAYDKPYIRFYSNDSLQMTWGGKILSHGTFTTDGHNIRYKEQMPDGTTRAFPFWVIKLTDIEIVFETTVADKSRVTAVKE
jgi:hypothetical protein